MVKFYHENKLASQNITAKSNVAWVADITSIELAEGNMLHIFLCVDIHTNKIVAAKSYIRMVSFPTVNYFLI